MAVGGWHAAEMACCAAGSKRGRASKLQPGLGQHIAEQHESRVAVRVTELIDPNAFQKANAQSPQPARGWAQHLPVVIVPGMCSSGLKVLQSSDEPSWENDRLWLSMQKLSANAVAGSRVGSMQQTYGSTCTIVIERAQRLPSADVNGLSDPFVKMAMFDDKGGLCSRMWQTSVKTKTLEPEWEEDFLMGTRENLDEASMCLIEVMDKDLGGGDDALGILELPLEKIREGAYEEPAWHKLEQGPNLEVKVQGSLRLSIKYEPAPLTPLGPPKQPPAPAIDDVFSKLDQQEAVEACDELEIVVTEGETTLENMQAAVRAHFSDKSELDPQSIFEELDTDGSGALDHEEVERATAMLGFLFNREQASEAFAEMDANDDGEVTLSEFKAWWSQEQLEHAALKVLAEAETDEEETAHGVPKVELDEWGKRVRDARNKLLGSSAWVRHMCLAPDG